MSDGRAHEPEDITRLVVERVKAGDAEGVAALYEPDAVLAFPPGKTTVGREAIRAVWQGLIAQNMAFKPEEQLPTLRIGDLALTATRANDEAAAKGSRRSPAAGRELASDPRSPRLPRVDVHAHPRRRAAQGGMPRYVG